MPVGAQAGIFIHSQLTALGFKGDQVQIVVAYGQMGRKGPGVATGLC